MAYKITDDCISCGACEVECKNKAIIGKDDSYEIDPYRCTECIDNFELSICAEVCPVGACMPDLDYRESIEQLLEKCHSLHKGETLF